MAQKTSLKSTSRQTRPISIVYLLVSLATIIRGIFLLLERFDYVGIIRSLFVGG